MHFTLSDLENMFPYEREAYFMLMEQRRVQHEQEKKNNKNRKG